VLTWIVRTLAKVRRSAERWLYVASAAGVVLGGNLSLAGTSQSVGVIAVYTPSERRASSPDCPHAGVLADILLRVAQ
jgi:hypothetical protein